MTFASFPGRTSPHNNIALSKGASICYTARRPALNVQNTHATPKLPDVNTVLVFRAKDKQRSFD